MVADSHAEQTRLMMRLFVAIFMLCISVSACAVLSTNNIEEKAVVHVVLIWLKEPGNHEHIQQVISASKQLEEIAYIQEMRVGKSIPSERTIVDDSFDVGLYMVFDNQKDMERYLVHPKHKSVVINHLKPLADKILVYDFL